MKPSLIPESTIKRLPTYLRIIENLECEGRETFSSKDFEERMGLNPAVFRKDLACLGNLGIRGRGYEVKKLKTEIQRLLGISGKSWETVVVGVGFVGCALMNYPHFGRINLEIIAAFDKDKTKINKKFKKIPILKMEKLESFIKENKIKFVILSVPPEQVDEMMEVLKKTKIKGIINFSPRFITPLPGMIFINVNITGEILKMFYHLNGRNQRVKD